MSSETEICNLALSHLGSGLSIEDLDADTTPEAAACRIFYPKCRKLAQREFPWPCFEQWATLAFVAEDPNEEWGFSYRLPSDCAFPIKIPSGQRFDNDGTTVPFTKSSDASGFLILTDKEEATLKFSKYEENVALFDVDFEIALSLLLAFYIAPRVAGGDPNRLGKRAYDAYRIVGEKAKVTALQETQKDVEPMCEMISARN